MIDTIAKRDAGRELFSIGGDIHVHLTENAISKFALWCAMGCATAVAKALRDITRNERKPLSRNKRMLHVLESRETSLRLSPLLLIVSAGKNLGAPAPGMEDHVETAKILLRHGASPIAEDALGKTVCHYGAGMMATKMTLEVVDMCIKAAKTNHLYGREVQLYGLSTENMNGRIGVAGGFDSDAGRRSVYLPDEDREVWIKAENIKLVSHSDDQTQVKLTDIQDRFGSVSLHEVIMTDREDVVEFLLKQHTASIHTVDMDGMTPLQLVSNMGQLAHPASRAVMKVAREEGRETANARKEAKREARQHCANCNADLDRDTCCSRCEAIWYCGKDCQGEY